MHMQKYSLSYDTSTKCLHIRFLMSDTLTVSDGIGSAKVSWFDATIAIALMV